MKHHNDEFFKLFIDELEDMYSSEHQIIEALPGLIKAASLPDLKDALSHHLKETEHQTSRIEKMFSILGMTAREKLCKGMRGILAEGSEMVKNKSKSPLLDATIISACQKVEHYEIASYGTLKAFAKQLDLESEIVDLIQDSLDEEAAADKKLSKIAEGTMFTSGINKQAVGAGSNGKHRH